MSCFYFLLYCHRVNFAVFLGGNIYKGWNMKVVMLKRGQITLFVIIGIVIVFVFGLLYYFSDYYGWTVPPAPFLEGPVAVLREEVHDCTTDIVKDRLVLYGQQGGDLTPSRYLLYQGSTVPFLCEASSSGGCVNKLFSLSQFKKQFQQEVSKEVKNCINPQLLQSQRGYTVQNAPLETTLDFSDDMVNVHVSYPVVFRKDDVVVSLDPFMTSVSDVPLQRLYSSAYDIIQTHAVGGDFDSLPYMLKHKGKILVHVDKVYPHTVYTLQTDDSDYVFRFVVEGVSNV